MNNYRNVSDVITQTIDQLYLTLSKRADVRTLIDLYMSLDEEGRTTLLQTAKYCLSRHNSCKG